MNRDNSAIPVGAKNLSPLHNRRSIRLKGYDYSQAGAYFITICTHNREGLFGAITNGEMHMNEYGRIVQDEWLQTAEIRPECQLGEHIVMPNHFHGILTMNCRGTACRAPVCRAPSRGAPTCHTPTAQQFGKPVANSFPTIIRSFKSAVTKRINEIRKSPGVPVWQRNYYEHVIRDDADFNRVAEYIADNPRRWMDDVMHPDNPNDNCDPHCRGTARRAPTERDTTVRTR